MDNGQPLAEPPAAAGINHHRDNFQAVLGFRALFSGAVGIVVGQNAIVSVLHGVGYGGFDFLVVLGIGFLFALCNAATFSELSLMLPRAGGLSTYTEVALGNFPAIVATFSGYVVVAMFGLSAEIKLVDDVMGTLFPGVLPPLVLPFTLLGVFVVLNIRGTDVFARLQNVLTFLTITICLALGLSALTRTGAPLPPGQVPFADWGALDGGIFNLMTLGIWAFTGLEFICPLIEEARDPARNIPRAMLLGSLTIGIVYLLLALGAGTYLNRRALLGPVPHLIYAVAVFGKPARIAVAVIALTASGSVVNTVLAGVSRMLYGMARNGQVFPVFKRLHRKHQTPSVAIVFMALITAVPLTLIGSDPDAITTLLIAASASWLLAYIVAHLDVIVLRRRMPTLARPFKTPLYPLPQVLGIGGMTYAIINNSPSPEMTKTVFLLTGVVLLGVSAMAAYWVKAVMKRGLFEPSATGRAS